MPHSFLVFIEFLQYCFHFIFWFFGFEACWILSHGPGMEAASHALEGEILNTGPPEKYLQVRY